MVQGEYIHFQQEKLKATMSKLFCHVLKRVYSRRKESTPNRSNFLSFRVDPIFRKANKKAQMWSQSKIAGKSTTYSESTHCK